MPRIEPIPWEKLTTAQREAMQAGTPWAETHPEALATR